MDYLLKPVSAERLTLTVDRLRDRLRQGSAPADGALQALLNAYALDNQKTDSYLQWLRTGTAEEVQLIAVEDVVYLQADRKYTSVFTADREHLLRTPLAELEKQLDPAAFWRIHRSTIVARTRDSRREERPPGRYAVTLRSRKKRCAQAPRISTSFPTCRHKKEAYSGLNSTGMLMSALNQMLFSIVFSPRNRMSGYARVDLAQQRQQLIARQPRPEAHVRTGAEGEMLRCVGAFDIKSVRILKHLRVTIGRGIRKINLVALLYRVAADL